MSHFTNVVSKVAENIMHLGFLTVNNYIVLRVNVGQIRVKRLDGVK